MMIGERTSGSSSARNRAMQFCQRFGLQAPILQAPMAGSSPVSLAVAVGNAGGMGGLGALLTSPEEIADWVAEFRSLSNGPLQLNHWIPESYARPRPRSRETGSKFPFTVGTSGAGRG